MRPLLTPKTAGGCVKSEVKQVHYEVDSRNKVKSNQTPLKKKQKESVSFTKPKNQTQFNNVGI